METTDVKRLQRHKLHYCLVPSDDEQAAFWVAAEDVAELEAELRRCRDDLAQARWACRTNEEWLCEVVTRAEKAESQNARMAALLRCMTLDCVHSDDGETDPDCWNCEARTLLAEIDGGSDA